MACTLMTTPLIHWIGDYENFLYFRVTLNSIKMLSLWQILNPQGNLPLWLILVTSLILGLLHGATPDEHTWPITFSYAIGSYSSRRGAKAGFLFSLGFTAQRSLLTTLGFLGLASFYRTLNLDGPVYIIVGLVMTIAGSYVVRGKYLHIPLDLFLRGERHHSDQAERVPLHEEIREVPLRMTVIHGLIAGFGFGAYATIITFVLAPQVPNVVYAPLPGLMFGLGTMCMQIIFGAAFGAILRLKGMSQEEVKTVGKKTAGKTLYYGGMAFVAAGVLVVTLPLVDSWAIGTGNPIPNLDAINIGFLLVVLVVGVIGIYSMIASYREVSKTRRLLK
jgi:hypothetical protein